MQIHQINKPDWQKEKRSIGRGGKRGTYSGKGNKGQKARSGGNIPPGFEGQDTTLVARSPKIIGFSSPKIKNIVLSLGVLEKNFKDGDEVNLKILVEKRLVKINKRSRTKRRAKVKILVGGDFKRKITIKNLLISEGAKKIVEKAGGSVVQEQISPKKIKDKSEPQEV